VTLEYEDYYIDLGQPVSDLNINRQCKVADLSRRVSDANNLRLDEFRTLSID